MKNLILIPILMALVFIPLACSSDDDGGGSPTDTNELIGSWRLVSEFYHLEDGDSTEYTPEGCDEELITFTDTQVSVLYDDNCDGVTDNTYESTYTVNDNKIITDITVAKITTLNENTLKLKSAYGNDPDDYTYYVEFTYEKL